MTGWTAIVPVNLGRECKTRLADRLSREARDGLVRALAAHVVAQLRKTPAIVRVVVLSPEEHNLAGAAWAVDEGRGLNIELAALFDGQRTLVVHGDLPCLTTGDAECLIASADVSGVALAPDRWGRGTNALAKVGTSPLTPCFGADSFARHRAAFPQSAVVDRPGLAFDIDTPADLEDAGAFAQAHPSARRCASIQPAC